mmetsp:Transcript_10066/g.17694  ORF Transcript_10066/g.17694 Transcript_10066/m.17694 type:complete len:842 (-) Transcript_10066:19-2544(-)
MEGEGVEGVEVLRAWRGGVACVTRLVTAYCDGTVLSRESGGDYNLNEGDNENFGIVAIDAALRLGLGPLLRAWTFQHMNERILGDVAEQFKKRVENGALLEALEGAAKALEGLLQVCRVMDEVENKGGQEKPQGFEYAGRHKSYTSQLRNSFDSALILSDARTLTQIHELVRTFLENQFTQFDRHRRAELRERRSISLSDDDSTSDLSLGSGREEEGEESADEVPGNEGEGEQSFDHGLLVDFSKFVGCLEWLEFFEEPLGTVLCQAAERRILRVCKAKFESRLLKPLRKWLESVALYWLRDVLAGCVDASPEADVERQEKFEQWKTRLEFHVFETLCELRMSELFDMIAEFPESSPALADLKDCLSLTHQHRELVSNLRHAFAARLLHPGANTAQILDVYIATIKALRLLDPGGVLLESISEPIKSYLRTREDTVRCIVTSLTDDQNSELFEELGRSSDNKPIAHDYDESDDEAEQDDTDANDNPDEWTPDPIEADPRKTSRSRRSNDILSMLVHIYGSKELFVNEYRLMLADKMLSNLDVDAEREVRNLELLKLRFGETSMLKCEIMVKDIEDSKRINANIKNTLKDRGPAVNEVEMAAKDAVLVESLDVTIVSKQCWPTLHGEDIKPHPVINERMNAISHEYSVLKNPRQLVWKTNLGLVHLELEFDDNQVKEFTVNPLLATLIMHLGERTSWTARDLAQATEIDEVNLQKRMAYWVSQGVVRMTKDATGNTVYSAVEKINDEIVAGGNTDEATESAVSADAQLEEEMKVYEDFVRGMLNNYESLPLDRIHNMLKMFVSTGEHKYEKNIQQLGAFLDKLVRDEVLEKSGGAYFLKKSK